MANSPTSEALRRQLALQLIAGQQTPQNIGQGLASIGRSLAGAFQINRLADNQATQEAQEQAALADLLRGNQEVQAGTGDVAGTPGLLPPQQAEQALQFAQMPGGQNAVMQAVAQRLFPQPGEGFSLSPGEVRFDARGQPIAMAPAAPEGDPTAVREMRAFGLDPSNPEHQQHYFDMQRQPAAQVNVAPGEREAAVLASRHANQIETEALPAVEGQLQTVNQLGSLIEQGLKTGFGPDMLRRASDLLGVQLTNQDAALSQFAALSNELTLNAAQQLSGTLSDSDIALLQSTVTDPSSSTEANRRRVAVMTAMLERKREILRETSRYITQNGTTAGLSTHIEQFVAQNPLDLAQRIGVDPAATSTASSPIGEQEAVAQNIPTFTRAEVEQTAKNRGMTFDQVLEEISRRSGVALEIIRSRMTD